MKIVKRGFVPEDEKEFFNEDSINKLKKAQKDIFYLIERGYHIKSASEFVGNHYMISSRQRLAVVRATSTIEYLKIRNEKKIEHSLKGKTVYIDGFNIIITLEAALSGSTLIYCMDKTIRDLASVRWTYRIIDKTSEAIKLLGTKLSNMEVRKVIFYLDEPVSNSGRLRRFIVEIMEYFPIDVQVEIVKSPDAILKEKENVITSDAIILNNCQSWINILPSIVNEIENTKKVILDTVPSYQEYMNENIVI